MRQIQCFGAACICAVVVREWNTILGIDICESYHYPGADFVPYQRQYSTVREQGAAIYHDDSGKNFAVSQTSLVLTCG